jgi:LacI family transcriptional regulator, galactose operon repressor
MARVGATLLQVANRCNVSSSTASRVLNNSTKRPFGASSALRAKLIRAAKELNYRPNMAARNISSAKTKLVAVLGLVGISSEFVGPLEQAVGAACSSVDKAGYGICVQFISRRHGPFEAPPLRVDGAIAVGARNIEELKFLDERGTPYVSLDGVAGRCGALVVPDDEGGIRMALRHLIELGHRVIAYLDHPSFEGAHHSVRDRRTAFASAAEELGFETPSWTLGDLNRTAQWGLYYERFLLHAVIDGKATAVLAYSHYGAMSLLREVRDMGLSVPRDFSLVCLNNDPVLSLSIPSLTAVDVPSAAMGCAAAEILLDAMSGKREASGRSLKMEETLIVRESSRPPSQPIHKITTSSGFAAVGSALA